MLTDQNRSPSPSPAPPQSTSSPGPKIKRVQCSSLADKSKDKVSSVQSAKHMHRFGTHCEVQVFMEIFLYIHLAKKRLPRWNV